MRTSRVAAAALAGLIALGAAGCDTGETSSAEPSPHASTSAPASATPTAAAGIGGLPPKPGPKERQAYLAALRKIDPDIIGTKDPDRIVGRGRDQCSSVKARPKDQAYLVKTTNIRFTAPGHPDGFGNAKAALILKTVRTYICPNW